MSSEDTKNGKKKKGGKIALIICIILIVLLCILIYFLLHKDDGKKRDVVVNEENVEEIVEDMMEGVAPGTYQVTMNSTWYFDNGTASSNNAYVENAEANENPVYFDIARSDTGETIYESPIIPIGNYLDDIALDEELPQGTHDCVMTYHLLDDDEETVSTVKVGIKIVVGP